MQPKSFCPIPTLTREDYYKDFTIHSTHLLQQITDVNSRKREVRELGLQVHCKSCQVVVVLCCVVVLSVGLERGIEREGELDCKEG